MSAALDWLAVGDVAEDRSRSTHPTVGGAAARLVAHAAALGASTALVGKIGDDDAGRRVRDMLARLDVDLRWLRTTTGAPTTVWTDADGPAGQRRVDRGADLAMRLDELPPLSNTAALTVVSGYSLSVEPARSAAMGALTGAAARGGRAALLVEAELLWWTNARTTRRALEPALAAADTIALTEGDARVLVGSVAPRQALRVLAEMGPRIIYLSLEDGRVLLRESGRVHALAAPGGHRRDRLAGPAAFWVGLARHVPPAKAAAEALRYAGAEPARSHRRSL